MISSPNNIVIISMFFQSFLTFTILIIMARRRLNAARLGELKLQDFRTMQLNSASEAVQVASRNFENQFEMPVLFFVVALLALQQNVVSWTFAIISIAYVLSRIVHSFVHVTSNHVRTRFRVFTLSCAILLALWLSFLATFI